LFENLLFGHRKYPQKAVRVRNSYYSDRLLGETILDVSGTPPFDRNVTGLGGGASIPGATAIHGLTDSVTFEFTTDDGATWSSAGSGRPTIWYIMPNLDTSGQTPYDLGYDKVVGYASGRSDSTLIVRAISSGIAGEIYYDPSQQDPTEHWLKVYDVGRAQCRANAELGAYLSRIAGIGATSIYSWSGSSYEQVDYYCYGTWAGPSFRTPLPAYEGAPANPHFTFHAQVTYIGDVSDPSYGTTGLVTFDEMCPPYSLSPGPLVELHVPPVPGETTYTCIQQFGWVFTPVSPRRFVIPCDRWRCPH